MTTQIEPDEPYRCRFCGKSQTEDAKLTVGVTITAKGERLLAPCICRECVELLVAVFATENPDWRDKLIERLQDLGIPQEDDGNAS